MRANKPWPVKFPKKPVTMQLHESMGSDCGNWNIIRVCNGWIYTCWAWQQAVNDWQVVSSAFVPIGDVKNGSK